MKPVTVQEVIDCLDYGDRMMCNQMVGRIRTHGITAPDGYAIVPIEACSDPDCKDGLVPKTNLYLDVVGTRPCVWCINVPQSRYNQNKAMLAVAPKQENE